MFKVKAEITPEPETLEHACDICPRTFKTLPGLKRHKTSHDRKPQETPGNLKIFIILMLYQLF
jgi:hypothetical protein